MVAANSGISLQAQDFPATYKSITTPYTATYRLLSACPALLSCQVQDAVYETQFSKTIHILAPEKKNCPLQPVNRRQEQNTSLSHPHRACLLTLSFVLSRGAGASRALAVGKPARAHGWGRGRAPVSPLPPGGLEMAFSSS